MAKRQYPVPGAIDGKPWDIQNDSFRPRVDLRKRTIWLNLSDDPQWAAVRAHELAHVVYTTKNARRPKDIDELILQAVEDMRVNTLAHYHAGISFAAGTPDHVRKGAALMCKDSFERMTLMLIAGFDLTDREKFRDELRPLSPDADTAYDLAMRAKDRLLQRSSVNPKQLTWATTKKVARWLQEEFNRRASDIPKDTQVKNSELITATAPRPLVGKTDEEQWGTMVVERPSLSKHLFKGSIRTAEEGTVLRAPWRVTTDGSIFRKLTVAKTGSILVDASGSMRLLPDEIQEAIRHMPAGIIAAYGSDGRKKGALRILGQRGAVANNPAAYFFGGGNVIDGPALRWLSTQPMPRIWVSDGIVTGIGDVAKRSLTADAQAICFHAGIKRARTLEIAIRSLK